MTQLEIVPVRNFYSKIGMQDQMARQVHSHPPPAGFVSGKATLINLALIICSVCYLRAITSRCCGSRKKGHVITAYYP